jgi:hypothetical protein
MQVHRVLATAGKVASGGLIFLALATLAVVGANVAMTLSAGSLWPTAPATLLSAPPGSPAADAFPAATPAEVLAARFPSDDAAPHPPTFSAAGVIPGGQTELFDRNALSGLAMVEPLWPAADGTAPADGAWPAEPDPTKPEPPKGAAGTSPRRSSARSPYVVNDAMIASIRKRLKLTAEQEKLWPPVEAALRKIVYTRAAMSPQRGQKGGLTAYIDLSSPEVNELKSAALPLLMRLNDEQKREVKELIYVMGLEAVASQF